MEPERLVFAPSLPQEAHLARLQLADIFLDTHPFTAHTTASDALWCGVPAVTCAGTHFSSRVAASLLIAMGLEELVASSVDGMIAIALDLARDPAWLARVKARVEAERSGGPLFNSTRYTRDFEALLVGALAQTRQAAR